jgi:hypothetical protein
MGQEPPRTMMKVYVTRTNRDTEKEPRKKKPITKEPREKKPIKKEPKESFEVIPREQSGPMRNYRM